MKRQNTQLKNLKRSSAPRKEFKQALKAELSAEFDAAYPGMRLNWTRMLAAPVAVFVLVITMGTGTYAYASPEVTPEHSLYPVKKTIERVEGEFQRTPEARAKFHARMMERRIAEAEVLQRKKQIVGAHVQEVANELNLTIESLQEVKQDPELREQILEQVNAQSVRYEYLIITTVENQIEDPDVTKKQLRNTFEEIRVHVDESDLTQEEKQELIERVKPDILELRNEVIEQKKREKLQLQQESEVHEQQVPAVHGDTRLNDSNDDQRTHDETESIQEN